MTDAAPTIDWATFVATAASGDVILLTGTREVDRAIALATGGPFCHAALVFNPGADRVLELWESAPGEMAPDLVDPANTYLGAQCGDLAAALNHAVSRGCAPYYRRLALDRTPAFEAEMSEFITTYDGKIAFGSLWDMAKNWAEGHFLEIAGPKNEVFCAELVAMTYQRLGLMGQDRPPNYYSPSSFSSRKDEVALLAGRFETEVPLDAATIPPSPPPAARTT